MSGKTAKEFMIHCFEIEIKLHKYLKPGQNKKGQNIFQLHRFVNTFLQLAAAKKYSKNGAAGNFFGPSYFVTALVRLMLRYIKLCCRFIVEHSHKSVKIRYCEKATKLEKKPLFWNCLVTSNKIVRLFRTFVAFSEYLNLNIFD